MQYSNSPVLALILRHIQREGMTRRDLAETLAEGGNRPKTFRRLDHLLRGERLVPGFVRAVAEALHIPFARLAYAWGEHELQENEREQEEERRFYENAMERRGPHLWVLLPQGYRPPLVSFVGTEFYLLVRLRSEIADLSHDEQMREVAEVAREHYRNPGRRHPSQIAGYEYRWSLDESFRFDVGGNYIGRVEGRWSEPRTGVSIGRARADTSAAGLLGRLGRRHGGPDGGDV